MIIEQYRKAGIDIKNKLWESYISNNYAEQEQSRNPEKYDSQFIDGYEAESRRKFYTGAKVLGSALSYYGETRLSEKLTINKKNRIIRTKLEERIGRNIKDFKIKIGRQKLHDPSLREFKEGKSEISVDTARKIYEEFAGKGNFYEDIKQNPTQITEIVNTKGKYTGIYVNARSNLRLTTSKFKIHYDTRGNFHIVPMHPKAK
ncbi:polymorphic toxin type 50 domain-containing protein [Leptotrichia trevisanii]|uniref:Bacterial toxin 50 domain-containing protein n=1 Tax=Leptotrichia trevisanii TaxID=109328 RepID=A0A510JZU0_9FUSO|nr:polymorphic toxin type 50 domain-containing protein [Leptotrichia trevisanii]BBM44912.1 hypothetical protein JMUB3870_1030 [Leptotrichia trevisanii]